MAPKTYQHEYPLENKFEVERLQSQHEVIKDGMGGLFLAPVAFSVAPLRILDSGTSDGTWIQDVAKLSGSVKHELYGTDVSAAAFPADPPAGTTYKVQDINKPWPKVWQGSFDFVHQRLVLPGGGRYQMEAIESLAALVKPGGWIQLIEGTHTIPDASGPAMKHFVATMKDVFTSMSCDLEAPSKMRDWLESIGFVDIHVRMLNIKLGALNPDPILASRGVFSTVTAAKGLATFGKTLPAGTMSLPVEILDTLDSELQQELIEKGAVYPLLAVWARKP